MKKYDASLVEVWEWKDKVYQDNLLETLTLKLPLLQEAAKQERSIAFAALPLSFTPAGTEG